MSNELLFSLLTVYKVKGDGSMVTLDVMIGNEGQSPDYSVKLNTKKLLEHSEESIKNFEIGPDTDIMGKLLKIAGNIADTSKDSNKIDVLLKLKGGKEEFKKKFSVTVTEEGEVVLFSFVIKFF